MEDKHVDESWKDSVASEKEKIIGEPSSSQPEPAPEGGEEDFGEVNFLGYISSLAFQAMIFMGEIPNPITNKLEKNLRQSKFLIDTLAMLKEKTKGNLAKQEEETLNAAVYELQMLFIEAGNKEGQQPS